MDNPAGLMRNVLYPAGKANYINMHQGPRNRQKEEQDKLSAAQQDKVTLERCKMIHIYADLRCISPLDRHPLPKQLDDVNMLATWALHFLA